MSIEFIFLLLVPATVCSFWERILAQSLAEDYQGFSQSMAQVFHNADERVRLLEAMEEQINSEVTK